jgi:hypothetical protein
MDVERKSAMMLPDSYIDTLAGPASDRRIGSSAKRVAWKSGSWFEPWPFVGGRPVEEDLVRHPAAEAHVGTEFDVQFEMPMDRNPHPVQTKRDDV